MRLLVHCCLIVDAAPASARPISPCFSFPLHLILLFTRSLRSQPNISPFFTCDSSRSYKTRRRILYVMTWSASMLLLLCSHWYLIKMPPAGQVWWILLFCSSHTAGARCQTTISDIMVNILNGDLYFNERKKVDGWLWIPRLKKVCLFHFHPLTLSIIANM